MLFIVTPCSSLGTRGCGFCKNISVQSIIIRVLGNLLKELGNFFLISPLQGHLRSMSRKTVDKKQIHVVKTLLTDPSDTPKISVRCLLKSLSLSLTKVKIHSSIMVNNLCFPGFFYLNLFDSSLLFLCFCPNT